MASADTEATTAKPRPLSPHLQVYKPLVNMVMSIFHRITGAALYFGTLLLAAWLIATAMGPSQFAYVNSLAASPLGLVVLLGYTWTLIHHMIGGLRHLVWDTGRGFDLGSVNTMSWGTLVLSLGLTAAIWLYALRAKGLI